MRPDFLASSIALLMAASAPAQAAMQLAADGRGDALVFPYYTVERGNQTLISVSNTTAHGKALKLRFREGSNSRSVREFNVYLGPFDVWTASVFDFNTQAVVGTRDRNCTAPAIVDSTSLPTLPNGLRYVPFSNFEYSGVNDDAGSDQLSRAREGHFEIIEMGEVTNATHQSLAAISGSNGVPANCARVQNAWRTDVSPELGYWAQQNALIDMDPPGGGLHGFAAVVNALDGTMIGYSAEAISGFGSVPLHAHPLLVEPTLADANGSGTDGVVEARVPIDGDFVTLRYPQAQAIDAVSALFTADSMYNDFVDAVSVGGESEWVLTFPTKHFYTDLAQGPAIDPFPNVFPREVNAQGTAPLDAAFDLWDRRGVWIACEPTSTTSNDCPRFPGLPPPPALTPTLNWAVNVLTLAQGQAFGSRILGSLRRLEVLAAYGMSTFTLEGSMALGFHKPWRDISHVLRPDLNGARLSGLPVTGFWAVRYTNRNVTAGVLANYSAAVRPQVVQALLPPQ
jgi:hypothetical protein